MPILNPDQGSGGGSVTSGGFLLGSPDNIFGLTSGDVSSSPSPSPAPDLVTAEGVRDSYFTTNPTKLTQYENNPALGIYVYYTDGGSNIILGQSLVSGEWIINNSIVGIQGQNGADGIAYEFANATERDTFFTNRPDLLRQGMPITITIEGTTVANNVWVGETAPVVYNPVVDNVQWVNASFRAGTASFELGDIHKISSGGENVFFINSNSNTAYFPPWQGHGDHSDPATRWVDNRPFARSYSEYMVLETGGVVSPTGAVTYDVDFTLQDNETVYGVKTTSAETYTGDLEYKRFSSDDKEVYSQKRNLSLTEGDPIEFWFEFPVENRTGESFTTKIMKPNGDLLSVRPTLSNPLDPYVEIRYRSFSDRIMMVEKDHEITPKNADFTAANARMYAVDTSSNTVNINATSSALNSFSVFDSHKRFNSRSCFVNFGGDVFELDTKNDYFRFYRDVNGNWRYQDIDQDNARSI